MTISTIDVAVPRSSYVVMIGPKLLNDVGHLIPRPQHASRAVVVSSGVPARIFAEPIAAALRLSDLAVQVIELPDGEANKTLATVERCLHAFARIPLGRDDFVVAVGGGVIEDMAGFAAATWNRGIPIVQVPTTLTAQVDAAVGGKTGVNLAEGKNLVGAFHQPSAVIADIETLATLPERERRAGLGEVAKYGFIADPVILEILEQRPHDAVACVPDLAQELVSRSVAVKARIVAADERDVGERVLLNYGHTIGHAIETLGGYQTFKHGQAVALGMVFAARLGERLGISECGLADRTESVLQSLGLPVGGVELEPTAIWELLHRDKKVRGGVRFVVCTQPGDALLTDPPDPRLVEEVMISLR